MCSSDSTPYRIRSEPVGTVGTTKNPVSFRVPTCPNRGRNRSEPQAPQSLVSSDSSDMANLESEPRSPQKSGPFRHVPTVPTRKSNGDRIRPRHQEVDRGRACHPSKRRMTSRHRSTMRPSRRCTAISAPWSRTCSSLASREARFGGCSGFPRTNSTGAARSSGRLQAQSDRPVSKGLSGHCPSWHKNARERSI